MKAVTSHTSSNKPGLLTWRAMSAETMKMPEPTIEPTTSMVASRSPRTRNRGLDSEAGALCEPGWLALMERDVGPSSSLPLRSSDASEYPRPCEQSTRSAIARQTRYTLGHGHDAKS